MNQEIAEDASHQAFDRDHAFPTHLTGQQRQQGGNEHEEPDCAEALGHWGLHFDGAKPACAQHGRKDHEQEGSNAKELEQGIRGVGAHYADPIARRVRPGQHGGAIPRGIERRVGDESEGKEERRDAHQESDQLVESPVPCGHKNRRQIIHEGRKDRRRHVFDARNRPEPLHYAKKRGFSQCGKSPGVFS